MSFPLPPIGLFAQDKESGNLKYLDGTYLSRASTARAMKRALALTVAPDRRDWMLVAKQVCAEHPEVPSDACEHPVQAQEVGECG